MAGPIGIGPRLDLRVSQQLVLSPQLQAAIKLLTLSNLELQAEIAAELEKNPLLDVASDEEVMDGGDAATEPAELSAGTGTDGPDAATLDQQLADDSRSPAADDLDVNLMEERFHHDCASDSGSGGELPDDFSFDSIAAPGETLAQALERQAAGLSGPLATIVLHLISLVDEAGYLTEPLEGVAERLSVPLDRVEAALATLQGFEPTGVGARTLAECIALQAIEADRYDPCMQALIANLDLVARGDLAQLRRLCDVDSDDLADMLRELRSYNPKPGLIFSTGRTDPIVPDVFIRRTATGWAIDLNSATLPRLIVNRQYQADVARHARDHCGTAAAERQYLDQCLSQAHWLMKALDQRAQTILKVATELVRQQQGFFDHGVAHLRPITLKTVADAVGMHESTVSRATSNKYLSCDRGLFELKYFFTTAIHSCDGSADASSEAVRQRIRALIDSEPPLKPLSDDKLVTLLNKEGYGVARRTVAKYREALGYPSSFDRRRRALVKAA